MMGVQPIEAVKKSFELLGTFIGRRVGLEVVNARFAAVWGPLGRAESRFFATPGLVHSAVAGEAAGSPTAGALVYAEDGIDHCYVKDCGRGIGLLQTAARLNHTTYNVGSGRATKNRQVAAAIMRAIPTAGVDLVEGRSPEGPGFDPYVDISRIHQDTGFEPEYDVERGVADYIEWLRSGHER